MSSTPKRTNIMTDKNQMTRKYANANKYKLPKTPQEAKDKNEIFYFTNKACLREHLSPRQIRNADCIECIEERMAKRKTLPCAARDKAKATESAARNRACINGELALGYDPEETIKFYLDSAKLTELTGEQYEVDHMIPLSRGGLHHQDNLLVMPKSMNRRKWNKTLPELITSDFVSDVLSALAYGKSVGGFIDE
jgi:hypothetical protein